MGFAASCQHLFELSTGLYMVEFFLWAGCAVGPIPEELGVTWFLACGGGF